jgi:hypothetical protein
MYVRTRNAMGDSGQFSTESRVGKSIKTPKLVFAPPAPAPRGPIPPTLQQLVRGIRSVRPVLQAPQQFSRPGSGSSSSGGTRGQVDGSLTGTSRPSEVAAEIAEAAAASSSSSTGSGTPSSSAPMQPYAGGVVALPKAAASSVASTGVSLTPPPDDDLFLVPDDAPTSAAFGSGLKSNTVKYIAIGAVAVAGLYFLTRKKTRR